MTRRSKISWTDYSGKDANFLIGCTPVSEGCTNCYARSWAKRSGRDFSKISMYPDKLRRLAKFSPVGGNRRGPNSQPMVFVCDLSDLFHRQVPGSFIWHALGTMAGNEGVDWQILTKRIDHAKTVLSLWGVLPRNMWMGCTCENQKRLDERLPYLRRIRASVRWLSLEPMLGPITFPSLEGIDWVVVGAESGPNRRPFNKDWACSVRDACMQADVAFFYKQSSGRYPGADPYLDGKKWEVWPC